MSWSVIPLDENLGGTWAIWHL